MSTCTAEIIPLRPEPSHVRVPPTWPLPADVAEEPWLKVVFVTVGGSGEEERWRHRVRHFLACHDLEVRFTRGRLGMASISPADRSSAPRARAGHG